MQRPGVLSRSRHRRALASRRRNPQDTYGTPAPRSPPSDRCDGARADHFDHDRVCSEHHRGWRDVPGTGLCEMGRGLQGRDRACAQLPGNRLWRRHPPDQGQDCRLRRQRRSAPGRRVDQGRPDPVPGGHRRRRTGRESPRRRARQDDLDRRVARQVVRRGDHQVERSGDREAQPRTQAAVDWQ